MGCPQLLVCREPSPLGTVFAQQGKPLFSVSALSLPVSLPNFELMECLTAVDKALWVASKETHLSQLRQAKRGNLLGYTMHNCQYLTFSTYENNFIWFNLIFVKQAQKKNVWRLQLEVNDKDFFSRVLEFANFEHRRKARSVPKKKEKIKRSYSALLRITSPAFLALVLVQNGYQSAASGLEDGAGRLVTVSGLDDTCQVAWIRELFRE